MSAHERDDAKDGHEIKRIKVSRLNASIAMLRCVIKSPENRRFRSEIKRAIQWDVSELIEIGGELWTKPDTRSRVVREFEAENHYEIKIKPGVKAGKYAD